MPTSDTLKALTLWQPYASLIMCKSKRFETRGWLTRHRGPLLVHSAKRYRGKERRFAAACHERGHLDVPADDMPLGSLLGICRVVDVHDAGHPALDSFMSDYEKRFGDFRPGRFAWELSGVQRFDEPIPWRGQQGLWHARREDLPAHALRALAEMQDSV